MPSFRVTVTASLKLTEHRDEIAGLFTHPRDLFSMPSTSSPSPAAVRALGEWASREPNRTFVNDASSDPPRATVTVIYPDITAGDGHAAELAGKDRFLEECDVVDPAEWESVLAVAEETD